MLLLSSFRGSAEVKRIVTQRLRRMEKRSHQIGPRPGTTQAEPSCPREAALRTVNEGNVPGALWDQDLSLGCSSATGSLPNSDGWLSLSPPHRVETRACASCSISGSACQPWGQDIRKPGGDFKPRGVQGCGRGWGGVGGGGRVSLQRAERAAGGVEDRRWGPGQWPVARPHWCFRRLLSQMSSGQSSGAGVSLPPSVSSGTVRVPHE